MDKNLRELKTLLGKLDKDRQLQLLDFARFLVGRQTPKKIIITEPEKITRPEEESVVAAMKRLNKTYPMLETEHILNEASALMAEHMMRGRKATEVIDELEAVFLRHYNKLKES